MKFAKRPNEKVRYGQEKTLLNNVNKVLFCSVLLGMATLLYFISFWFCKRNASDEGKIVGISTDEAKDEVIRTETTL